MGKVEICNFSTSLQLDTSQVSAVIFYILQAMQRRKIVKMVNLGKEFENGMNWNEKKLGPCMNVFLSFIQNNDFKKDIKEIETWKAANRLWNDKMI